FGPHARPQRRTNEDARKGTQHGTAQNADPRVRIIRVRRTAGHESAGHRPEQHTNEGACANMTICAAADGEARPVAAVQRLVRTARTRLDHELIRAPAHYRAADRRLARRHAHTHARPRPDRTPPQFAVNALEDSKRALAMPDLD